MTANALTIREAIPADAESLAVLIREAFREPAARFGLTPENCPTHPSNCTVDWIADDMDRGISYYLSEANGRAAGCVALEPAVPDHWYLERLAVLPAFQGQGHGTALVRRLIAEASQGGAHYLSIGIIADDTDLKDWYLHRGFREGKTRQFKHLPFRALFMTYAL